MRNQTTDAPLAWSQSGDPIELPPSAVLWRVRRLNGGSKGGAPEIVYGSDGLPLAVDIGITPQDFAEAVERRAAKYRLDALDENRRPIPDVPAAYVVVGGPAAARGDEPKAEPAELAVRTLSEALTKQTAQIATLVDACARLVAAVDSAGVSKREPPAPLVPVTPVAVEERPAQPEPTFWQAVLPQLLPMIPQALTLLQAFLASNTPAPSAVAPATGGTP